MDFPRFKNEYTVLEEDKCLDRNFDRSRNIYPFLTLLEHRIANGDMTVVGTYNICAFGPYESSDGKDPMSVQLAKERAAVNHEIEIHKFLKTMDVDACWAEIEELKKNYKGENLKERILEIANGYI